MLKFFKRGPKKPPVESNIKTLTRNGADYFAQDLILLNEQLTGNFYCAEDIVLEDLAQLTGTITGKKCIISGKTTGNVVATEHLIIKETAVINGNINAPSIDIELGAIINGSIKIATDIYAMVALTDKLKRHLVTEELPAKLNIAADLVALPWRAEEPGKISAPKTNNTKPAPAAPKPVTAETQVLPRPTGSKLAAAALDESIDIPTQPVSKAIAAKPTAAAPSQQVKHATADADNGKWW